MYKLILILFFFHYAELLSQSMEVELIADGNGDIIVTKTREQSDLAWAQMLIRKTSGLSGVPLVDSIYTKYYWRIVEYTNGQTDTVATQGMNFREHQALSNIKRAFDRKKSRNIIRDNLARILQEIDSSEIYSALPDDEIEEVKVHKKWPWGTLESKQFSIMELDIAQAKYDSLKSDSVRWRINPLLIRDSVIVCGESFRTLTPRKLNKCVDIPQKVKAWFTNNIGVQHLDTPLWNILKDYKGQFKTVWMRHPKFRKQVSRWIKRQL